MLGRGAIAPGPSIWSEPAGAVRGTQAGGAVPADTRGAQLRRRAGSVAARGDVEERPGVCVGEVVVDAGLVTGQAVDAGDDRRGDAGRAEAAVPGAGRHGDTRVVVERTEAGVRGVRAAVAVADGVGAHGRGPVDRGAEVGQRVRGRLDKQDVAVRADR